MLVAGALYVLLRTIRERLLYLFKQGNVGGGDTGELQSSKF